MTEKKKQSYDLALEENHVIVYEDKKIKIISVPNIYYYTLYYSTNKSTCTYHTSLYSMLKAAYERALIASSVKKAMSIAEFLNEARKIQAKILATELDFDNKLKKKTKQK